MLLISSYIKQRERSERTIAQVEELSIQVSAAYADAYARASGASDTPATLAPQEEAQRLWRQALSRALESIRRDEIERRHHEAHQEL